ncbi:glycosyltransferase family 2 protein [Pedobacter paludis]|uniref:Glycosyltransferase n=1 Tax=Pedobacter paludis TaxID=2203212 RepID=A0A317EXX8_9SPHI|nr:glycosyltransferase [Pedobacter paludis]PWS31691.1 glycosyltransferase [Pedobacter paludis]
MINIDIIILSYTKNEKLKQVTEQTIDTLLKSEDAEQIKFNILVIESNGEIEPFQYKNSTTVYPREKFGFHKFLNIGAKLSSSNLICFCNNDLIFHRGWATSLINAMNKDPELACLCPYCPIFHGNQQNSFDEINYGFVNGINFTGWCFMIKRSTINITGKFDEHFKFWYADDDYRLTLKCNQLKNAMIKSAMVTHLGSETLSSEKISTNNNLILEGFAYYKYKWIHHNFSLYLYDKLKYWLKERYLNFNQKKAT